MKRIKLKKGYIAGVLALVLCAAAVKLPFAYGAGAVDKKANCSLTLQVSEDQIGNALSNLDLTASLYKVADISEIGSYDVTDTFKQGVDLSDITDTTTADEWQKKAQAANEIVEAAGDAIEADASLTISNGTGTSPIEQGMYLVKVAEAQDEMYEYAFTPYLISVPDNHYYSGGNDSWIYSVTAGLKAEQTPRMGSLEIVKSVSEYVAGEKPMFVFRVEAVDKNNEKVYSNVHGLSFDKAGTQSIKVDDIPAGSTVTVEEVYGGANYVLTGGARTQNVNIAADGVQRVEFENTYNDELTPGTGVINHFEKDDSDTANNGWHWTQMP